MTGSHQVNTPLSPTRAISPKQKLQSHNQLVARLQSPSADPASLPPSFLKYPISHLRAKNVTIPADFFCPISLDIMRDPVTVASGQTYERGEIERWFREGHRYCPVTRSALEDLHVAPNKSLRSIISAWCLGHGIRLSATASASAGGGAAVSPRGVLTPRSDYTPRGEQGPQQQQQQQPAAAAARGPKSARGAFRLPRRVVFRPPPVRGKLRGGATIRAPAVGGAAPAARKRVVGPRERKPQQRRQQQRQRREQRKHQPRLQQQR
ncbi:hypothetical protein CLOM_g1888 [Closterium sp. NIES-68]|nr:hypothetical protein CLOM_g1888 [Closterium sp. NIES-68]